MSRGARRGVTLVEVLVVTAIVAAPLLTVLSLIGSNVRATAHNRERILGQLLLNNMVERYGRLPPARLAVLFGDPAGGRDALAQDRILNGETVWTSEQLQGLGYVRDAFFHKYPGVGVAGVLYLVVSYKDINGREQRLAQNRVVGAPAPGAAGGPGAPGAGAPAAGLGAGAGGAGWGGDGAAGGPPGGAGGGPAGRGYAADPFARSARPSEQVGREAAVARERQAFRGLADRLQRLDSEDGRVDYAWDAARQPDENLSALGAAVQVLESRALPDGDYPYRFELMDYRQVDPGFGTPGETLELTIFLLRPPGEGGDHLLMLERHGFRGRPAPVAEFLNGQLLRQEGLHDQVVADRGVVLTCWPALTPTRLYVARPGREADGSLSRVATELLVRTFEPPWSAALQATADASAGTRGVALGDQLLRLYDSLGVAADGRAPGPRERPHPYGL